MCEDLNQWGPLRTDFIFGIGKKRREPGLENKEGDQPSDS